MQLNSKHTTGGIRGLIIASTDLLLAPLNTCTQNGAVQNSNAVLDYSVLGNSIKFDYMPNDGGRLETDYITNKGLATEIKLLSVGIDHIKTQKFYSLPKKLVLLVNLYSDTPDKWIILGDKHQPVALSKLNIDSKGANKDSSIISATFNLLTRNPSPFFTAHL